MSPIDHISEFLEQLKSQNQLAPICLSTISNSGSPNSRFVDLKEVSGGRLFFGTDERSTKAKEFHTNSKVSICAWWERIQVQVRVIGKIEKASDSMSDRIFLARNPTAKAIATISCQSQELTDFEGLRSSILEFIARSRPELDRPSTWSVYGIIPTEIEILTFSEDRIHRRRHYSLYGKSWLSKELSP